VMDDESGMTIDMCRKVHEEVSRDMTGEADGMNQGIGSTSRYDDL